MRLMEIEAAIANDPKVQLKTRLSQPGKVDVVDASFSSGSTSLGTLEDIGAGKIVRSNPPYTGEWFGFEYFEKFPDGTPIQADIQLSSGRVLTPGEHFIEDV